MKILGNNIYRVLVSSGGTYVRTHMAGETQIFVYDVD